jgi:biopolymer transport protein ExbD
MGMQLGNQPLHTNEPEVMMEINTTPLIDVMLVLLIMLIITIPAQLHSVNLDLPVAAPSTKKVEPVVIKIEVDANNQIAWNGKALASREELQSKLQEASQREPQPELHVRSHAKAKYETTMAVMANAQRLGLKKLGIVGAEQFAY